MKGDILVAIIMFTLVLSSTLYILTYQFHAPVVVVEKRILLGGDRPGYASLKLTCSYNIVVNRGGSIIANISETNDPLTIQFYRIIANMLFGYIRDGALTWYDTGYNSHTWIDTETVSSSSMFNPKIYIALGSGSGTPSRLDYAMFNLVDKALASMSVTDDTNNNRYIVLYTKTFTIVQAFTLREVGLLLYVDTDPTEDISYAYVLIAHDIVDAPVDLLPQDSVTVTYRIYIPYNTNGPFTKWFYHALINYYLGYKGTTGNMLTLKKTGGATGVIDTGVDNVPYYANDPKDAVNGEYVFVVIGDGQSTVSPLYETYALSSQKLSLRIDYSEFFNDVNESETFMMRYVVSFSVTESIDVSEIGVLYYTDTDGTMNPNSYSPGYYLWLYWVLAQPVHVDPGHGLRVVIIVEIPYT